MHAYILGGSKNIGYYAAVRLLEKGASVTFLLRNTSTFDNDATIQTYIKQGKVFLVKGDGLNLDDQKKGWETALENGDGTIDVVLFTIGGVPNFHLTKGFVLTVADLCTRSLLNLFQSMPASLRIPTAQPRFLIVTSRGITHSSHATLPGPLKAFYGYALPSPHADKLGAERVLAYVMGVPWRDEAPRPEVLPGGWEKLPGLPAEGEIKRVHIVRPSLLTDGACKADEPQKNGKAAYRAVEGEINGGYTVSRRDVAHFMVEDALPNWEKWEGKGVTLVY
ncbi:hypothetical protein C8Q77DRAFT_498323 [Trametes polyzona]|nr:hypothetical protein C8Q77DRAFT_498323 [Trametes polyzona]